MMALCHGLATDDSRIEVRIWIVELGRRKSEGETYKI
jgi:hypothetical protein